MNVQIQETEAPVMYVSLIPPAYSPLFITYLITVPRSKAPIVRGARACTVCRQAKVPDLPSYRPMSYPSLYFIR